MGDSIISVEHLSKKYCRSIRRGMYYTTLDVARRAAGLPSRQGVLRKHEFWALDDVSFEMRPGECMGLIGGNGAGKSTLLKLLSGIIPPDRGRLRVRGRVGALIEVGAGFHPALSGRENVYINGTILGMTRKEIDERFDSIVEFANIPSDALDAPVRTYSSGMYVRLGYAIAIHSSPDVLFVDEVLAVGDVNFQAKCLNALGAVKRNGTTVILTTHIVNLITNWADKVLALDYGRILAYGPTKETIRKFLDVMAGREQTALPPVDDAVGSGRARIVSVHLMDADGRQVERAQADEPVELTIQVEAQEELQGVDLDVWLFDADDKLLASTGDLAEARSLVLPKGLSQISLRYPPVPLNGGSFRPAVSLWARRREELLDRLTCEAYAVATRREGSGSLAWRPRCRVIPLESTPPLVASRG